MRILGIDLSNLGTVGRVGNTQIRAVELDSAFGRTQVYAYHEIPILPGAEGDPQGGADVALKKLIDHLSKPADRIVTALPIQNSTFRNLQLPTKDKKAVLAAVGFELEDELPFPTEDTVFDYSLISQSKQGSEVHVAATLKRHLIQAIQNWNETDVEPDIITTEPWAFRSLMNRVLTPNQQQTPALLIHLNPESTTFYLHWRSLPEYLTESNWGGRELTLETAVALEGFVTEIRQLELLARKLTQQPIGLIYLAGATEEAPDLPLWLESRLGISTRLLAPWTPNLTDGTGAPLTQEIQSKYCFPMALALTAIGTDRSSIVNFRKGEFSKSGKAQQFNFKILKKPMMALGTVAVSLFLSLIIQSSVYQSRLANTNTQLEKSIKSFYGQISGSAIRTYLTNTSTLRKSIKSELDKQRELNRLLSPNPRSPLDFLALLSVTLPKSTVTDLVYFQSGTAPSEPYEIGAPASTTMTFLISNPQMAEKLASSVGSKVSNLQRSKMEEVGEADNGGGTGKKMENHLDRKSD